MLNEFSPPKDSWRHWRFLDWIFATSFLHPHLQLEWPSYNDVEISLQVHSSLQTCTGQSVCVYVYSVPFIDHDLSKEPNRRKQEEKSLHEESETGDFKEKEEDFLQWWQEKREGHSVQSTVSYHFFKDIFKEIKVFNSKSRAQNKGWESPSSDSQDTSQVSAKYLSKTRERERDSSSWPDVVVRTTRFLVSSSCKFFNLNDSQWCSTWSWCVCIDLLLTRLGLRTLPRKYWFTRSFPKPFSSEAKENNEQIVRQDSLFLDFLLAPKRDIQLKGMTSRQTCGKLSTEYLEKFLWRGVISRTMNSKDVNNLLHFSQQHESPEEEGVFFVSAFWVRRVWEWLSIPTSSERSEMKTKNSQLRIGSQTRENELQFNVVEHSVTLFPVIQWWLKSVSSQRFKTLKGSETESRLSSTFLQQMKRMKKKNRTNNSTVEEEMNLEERTEQMKGNWKCQENEKSFERMIFSCKEKSGTDTSVEMKLLSSRFSLSSPMATLYDTLLLLKNLINSKNEV